MIGSLLYLSNGTRPDIAFAVNFCARFTSNPSQEHYDAVIRIFSYVKGTKSYGLTFLHGSKIAASSRLITGFVDSDYANCLDTRRFTTGYLFLLAGAPVSWASRRQKVVATATLDAEYMAVADAAKEAVWLRRFTTDLRLHQQDSVTLFIDND